RVKELKSSVRFRTDELAEKERALLRVEERRGELERALEPLRNASDLYGQRGLGGPRRRVLERRRELLDDLQLPADDPRRQEQKIAFARLTSVSGDPSRARDHALEIWRELDEDQFRLRTHAAILMAKLVGDLGDSEGAWRWAENALEASRQTQDPGLQAECCLQSVWTCFFAAEFSRAGDYAKSAYDLAERAGDHYTRLSALRLRGIVMEAQGDERAVDVFERVRREAADAGYVVLESYALHGLAEHARFAGRLDEARRFYRQDQEKIEELSRPTSIATGKLNLAQVELRAGNLDHGYDHLRTATMMLEHAGAEELRRELLHLLRLTHAAGTEDAANFQQLWSEFEAGWPKGWQMNKDVPWLLETAGEYAMEAGWRERARDVWQLAHHLWKQVGDDAAAEQLDRRLADLT
ncbi:MAG: hypothetical protein ABEN55_21955, partial [Bradymonadaceae bacterium]